MLAASAGGTDVYSLAMSLGPFALLTLYVFVYLFIKVKHDRQFRVFMHGAPLALFVLWAWLLDPKHTLANFIPELILRLVGNHFSFKS
jgi:hypothetical protein